MSPVDRARALIGTRFRPQGRSAKHGLDCLGLVALAYGVPLETVPSDYHLRGDHAAALGEGLTTYFRTVRKAAIGDLLMLNAGRSQVHLALKSDVGFIHADVRRGVIETPGEPRWPLLKTFRRKR